MSGEKRLVVEETVIDAEQYDGSDFHFGASHEDGSLDRVIASLNKIRDQIPESYRATARCEISSTSGYEGSHYASICVTYERPATAEETAQWYAERKAETDAREAKDRADFEALKAKYG